MSSCIARHFCNSANDMPGQTKRNVSYYHQHKEVVIIRQGIGSIIVAISQVYHTTTALPDIDAG